MNACIWSEIYESNHSRNALYSSMPATASSRALLSPSKHFSRQHRSTCAYHVFCGLFHVRLIDRAQQYKMYDSAMDVADLCGLAPVEWCSSTSVCPYSKYFFRLPNVSYPNLTLTLTFSYSRRFVPGVSYPRLFLPQAFRTPGVSYPRRFVP